MQIIQSPIQQILAVHNRYSSFFVFRLFVSVSDLWRIVLGYRVSVYSPRIRFFQGGKKLAFQNSWDLCYSGYFRFSGCLSFKHLSHDFYFNHLAQNYKIYCVFSYYFKLFTKHNFTFDKLLWKLIKKLNYNQQVDYDIDCTEHLLLNQMPLRFFFLLVLWFILINVWFLLSW